MRLFLQQYISGLREREELDALIPDLLTEMGLHVFSRPSVGVKQYGVDIGAVGSLGGQPETVYLFSVKPGNLGRSDWDGSGPQCLRASLDEIREVYIPTHLPPENRGKRIVIVLCIGGQVRQELQQQVAMYKSSKATSDISYEDWDGDRISQLIEQHLLSENLVPALVRADLRKAIALVEEPDASLRHFRSLADAIRRSENKNAKDVATGLRKLAICAWVLFVWSRESGNLESACRATELALLYGWHIARNELMEESPSKVVGHAFGFLLSAYLRAHGEYAQKVSMGAKAYLGLSIAAQSSLPADINLSLFNVIGRLANYGLWLHLLDQPSAGAEGGKVGWKSICGLIKAIVANNPALRTPLRDDHVVDIGLVLLLMSLGDEHEPFMRSYLDEVTHSSLLAMDAGGPYPCTLRDYSALLRHPVRKNPEYLKQCTESSVLYPTLAAWAAIVGANDVYESIRAAKQNQLSHCTFQAWSPGKDTEVHLYVNDSVHGTAFLDLELGESAQKFLQDIWAECEAENSFDSLSCIKTGYYPILLTACRRYRLPVPWHLTRSYRAKFGMVPDKGPV